MGLREWMNSSGGKTIATAVAALIVAGAGWSIYVNGFQSDSLRDAREPVYICAQTGKTFRHRLTLGETNPVESPYSGKKTGYPAEPCYWTKDGKPKTEPTWVLLNTYAGKPEPTFCPDCGRRVVGQNPAPDSGLPPPPTEAEWKARGRPGG